MKRLVFLYLIVIVTLAYSQEKANHFYLGGNLGIYFMDGSGMLENEEFKVTDDLLSTENNVFRVLNGFGWKNSNTTFGEIIIGYHISEEFAIQGSYNSFATKEGMGKGSINTEISFDITFEFLGQTFRETITQAIISNLNARMRFEQSSLRLMLQYYPIEFIYLTTGIDYTYLQNEIEIAGIVELPGLLTYPNLLRWSGDESILGFIVGTGLLYRIPIESRIAILNGIYINGSIMYLISNYEGNKLLVGGLALDNLTLNIKLSGLTLSGGIRVYLP